MRLIDVAALVGEAALVDPVRRAGHLVVEIMRRSHHAEAGIEQKVDIGRVALQRVRAFERQQRGDDAGLELAAVDKNPEIAPRLDQHQPAVGRRGEGPQPVGLVERALHEAEPGPERPALRQRQEQDVVGIAVIVLDVEVARALGDHGKHLQRDIALDQPRQVDMAAIRPLAEVAPPQQRVGMQVGDGRAAHARPCLGRGGIGRAASADAVQRPVDPFGNDEKEDAEPGHQQRQDAVGDPFQGAFRHAAVSPDIS